MTDFTFGDLGVAAPLEAALKRTGIDKPFPIQSATLPDSIAGRDVLARGQTGSGKTLAFGLAVLSRLRGKRAVAKQPLALILVPTRELAMQVKDTMAPLSDSVDLKMRLVVGGMAYSKQIQAISKGVHILVATPGRLIDLVNRGDVDLSQVSITVLDEADQMADMGFLPDMKEILDQTKPNGQRLLFSATLDGDVDVLARTYLNDPARHSLQSSKANVATMEHHVFVIHPKDKSVITAQIGARDGQTLFFVKTQRAVDQLAEQLADQGVAAGALHGGKSQAVRTRTLEAFRTGTTNVLVATDVAARGIHIDGIDLVVHVDAPQDAKDYVHRAGRTARAGAAGTVITLAYPKQQRFVTSLTGRAGVEPSVSRIRPNSNELVEITGAREPSGVPWVAPAPTRTDRPKRQRPRRSTGSTSRPRASANGHKDSVGKQERSEMRPTSSDFARKPRSTGDRQSTGETRTHKSKSKPRWSQDDRKRRSHQPRTAPKRARRQST